MAWKHLGETFDIHGGGIDLVFPHHENEIAQSRCAFHTPLMARTWMHNGFLQVEGEKMAKSEGNFFTIRELLNSDKFGGRSWSGDNLRFAMLQTHYRQPIDWTVQLMNQSVARLTRWREFAAERIGYKKNRDLYDEIMGHLCDDLNTPAAFATVDRVVNSEMANDRDRYTVFKVLRDLGFKGGSSNVAQLAKNLTSVLNGMSKLSANDWRNIVAMVKDRPTLRSGKPRPASKLIASANVANNYLTELSHIITPARQFDLVFSLEQNILKRFGHKDDEFDRRVLSLLDRRNAARRAKNFAEADRIRAELSAIGVELEDHKDGTTTWKKSVP
jgi:cysteinyl-tRNA synthetase